MSAPLGHKAEDRLVHRVGVFLVHAVRGGRDLDSSGVGHQLVQAVGQPPQGRWAPLAGQNVSTSWPSRTARLNRRVLR